MNTSGKHLLIEYRGCDTQLLAKSDEIRVAMLGAAKRAQLTVVAEHFHQYRPQGVSGVLVIKESHLSIHTWPETGYAAVDLYTCGSCDPMPAHDFLQKALGASKVELMIVDRGRQVPGMRMHRLQTQSSSEPGTGRHRPPS